MSSGFDGSSPVTTIVPRIRLGRQLPHTWRLLALTGGSRAVRACQPSSVRGSNPTDGWLSRDSRLTTVPSQCPWRQGADRSMSWFTHKTSQPESDHASTWVWPREGRCSRRLSPRCGCRADRHRRGGLDDVRARRRQYGTHGLVRRLGDHSPGHVGPLSGRGSDLPGTALDDAFE